MFRFPLAAAALALPLFSDDILVFSFFRDNGQDGLHLAASMDGLSWTELNSGKPLLKPEVGESKLVRDPSIALGPDGVFHMVWTTSWNGVTIGYANSKDLKNWSAQREIRPFADSTGVRNCWAPELFYDAPSGEFWIILASTIDGRFPETANTGSGTYNHRLYSIRTRDFKTFTPAQLFYDPGFQVIDGAVFRDGDRYVLVAKNETEKPEAAKYIFLAFAPKLSGPWSKAGPAISGRKWAEGPTPVRIGEYWYLFFDFYRDHQYGAIRSKNLLGWEDLTKRLQLPEGLRHGTVFHAPSSIVEALR